VARIIVYGEREILPINHSTQPAEAPAPAGPSQLAIRSARWERVQLVLSARLPASDAAGAVRRVRLVRADAASRELVRPVHVSAGEHDAVIRLNVMQGPNLDPLEPGRWRLVSVSEDDVREPTTTSGQRSRLDRAEPVRVESFALGAGRYSVVPAVAEDGGLVLDVDLDRSDLILGDRSVPARLRGLASRAIRRTKRRGFSVAFAAFRALPAARRPRVLFVSDSRDELGGNLGVVRDRMVARGLHRRWQLVTLLKGRVSERRGVRVRLRLAWELARASVIVLDDYQPAVTHVPPDPARRIIQLWHASGAFKTVGYSRVGKPGGPSPFSRIHKNYTNAIVSSNHDVPFYAEAFGIPEERVVPTGIPRMDRFFDPDLREDARRRALAEFPTIAGRRTIMLAPTFRGTGPSDAWYPLDRLDLRALHAVCVECDAVALIKMHPFVRDRVSVPAQYADRIVDATRARIDVNDLLFAVDLLVTDYSSIVFEYSTLGRPMIFYAYDLEEYVAERDFYEPFEEFVPGPIVRSFPELLDAIRSDANDTSRVEAFANRHFAHLDGRSTDRVIDELIVAT
jgi:CDP-ribitol ribitolphosphotransferase / teichoic acid ribitol-phosphate polymerase